MQRIIENLKNGKIIEISKKGYTPTKFLYNNGKVYYKNTFLSGCDYTLHPSNLEELQKHFENMKRQNFDIKIVN